MNARNSIIVKNLFYICSQFDCNILEDFNSGLCVIQTYVREELCMKSYVIEMQYILWLLNYTTNMYFKIALVWL